MTILNIRSLDVYNSSTELNAFEQEQIIGGDGGFDNLDIMVNGNFSQATDILIAQDNDVALLHMMREVADGNPVIVDLIHVHNGEVTRTIETNFG